MTACAVAFPAAAVAAGSTARTGDADGDGRLDRVVVRLGVSVGAHPRATVQGHAVRRVARRGRRGLLILLVERTTPDSATRPRVVVRVRGRRVVMRARDRARPVLLGAVADGADGLVTSWSEPVAVGVGALRARDAAGRRLPQRATSGSGSPRVTIRLMPGSDPARLDVPSGAARDRARNAARASSSAVRADAFGAVDGTALGSDLDSDLGGWNVLHRPIDASEQTDLAFCDRSQWYQPWRGYLDTRPAAALSAAAGVNLNVDAVAVPATARLLAAKGFRRARLEVGWSEISYDDPDRLRSPEALTQTLQALRANGIRPLLLLNANQGAPGPAKLLDLRLTASAPAGAREVQLDAPSAAAVVPGLTGLSDLHGEPKAAEAIITQIAANGMATLSQPLPGPLGAGPHPAATLRFAPFTPPYRADGTANPRFEATLSGWLRYVAAVTRTAREALGDDSFDVEIWNELSFGSDFLDAGRYYAPLPADMVGVGDTTQVLLERTIAWLRNPANGVAGVGISDGFASQTPFAAGSTSPAGLTALSKHPYTGPRIVFDGTSTPRPCRPLDALGRVSGTQVGPNSWVDSFTPSYTDFFPEYYLSAIQTEHLVRDVSPLTTAISGVAHGRATSSGGAPPQVWVTETNMDPAYIGRTAAETRHMQAKATLRTLVSFVSKGVAAIDFYAVRGRDFGLVDDRFFEAGDLNAAGETVDAVGRLLARVGSGTPAAPRSLELRSIADRDNHVQFAGDGTAAHPPLYDREVVAFFPFQASARRFVVPAYVMTRDVARELAPEVFRLEIGGVDGAAARLSAYDPLTGTSVPVRTVARTGDSVTVQIELTDSPRLIELDDA